jgi:hypothetical protein
VICNWELGRFEVVVSAGLKVGWGERSNWSRGQSSNFDEWSRNSSNGSYWNGGRSLLSFVIGIFRNEASRAFRC